VGATHGNECAPAQQRRVAAQYPSSTQRYYTATRYGVVVVRFPWVKTHGYQYFVPMGQAATGHSFVKKIRLISLLILSNLH
jgi:hypothetical protein